jgi:putative transposase
MSVVKFNNHQWDKILSFLKTCPNIYIGQENECRQFLEAVFWITRSGSQWRLLPDKYGNWNTIYKRFARWSQAGIFEKLFEHISQDRDLEYLLIDSTIVRAHACSAGAQKKKARSL